VFSSISPGVVNANADATVHAALGIDGITVMDARSILI
jgi:hypothetical protein